MTDRPSDLRSSFLSAEDLPAEQVSLALLARAQAGDHAALQDLCSRYSDRLHRIVRIQLGSSPLRRMHDSMDLVQNTFLAALPKIGELRPRSASSLLHWLSIIATHQIRDAIDHNHAQKRDARRQLPFQPDDSSSREAPVSPKPTDDPGHAAELAEMRQILDQHVADLPEDQRRVVLMRDYCGQAWDQIAVELHREAGAARQLHQRAWITLRRHLRPLLEDQDSTE